MYLPPHFNKPEHAHALMQAHPLAQLISVDEAGFPFVTPLPLTLELRADQPWLLGHLARANPHAKLLAVKPQALVTFMGPQAYMPASVYPDLKRVPTWNYLTVHASVRVHMLDGDEAKDNLLKPLIAEHDPPYAAQWRGLPEDYTHAMLSGIVAFELEVTELRCKVKLNQHRPEAHAKMHAAYAQGTDAEQQLAAWMQRLGLI